MYGYPAKGLRCSLCVHVRRRCGHGLGAGLRPRCKSFILWAWAGEGTAYGVPYILATLETDGSDKAMIETIEVAIAATGGPAVAGQYRPQERTTIMTIEKNRRAAQRFKAKPGSNVAYVEGAGPIRDLSTSGIFVLDPEPLEIGASITFSVSLGSETTVLQGIVRRSVPLEGMGIQLTEVPREIRRRLVSHFACLS